MDLIRLAIRQPVTVIVGVILIVLAGLVSLGRIPIQLTPNVENTNAVAEGANPASSSRRATRKLTNSDMARP